MEPDASLAEDAKPSAGYSKSTAPVAEDATPSAGASEPAEPVAEDAKDAKPSAGYSDPSKWESRYEEQDGTFDWYATYKELKAVFEEFCPPHPDPSVLMLGCGNSALSGEMHEAGYRKLTNIDISASAVKKMEEQFAGLGQEWRVMDATDMSFDGGSFDLQVDKGTLDAMMHGGSEGESLASAMTAEVWRTLRPGGVFLLVSHNGVRQPILDKAVSSKHGTSAQWELLDLRKCALSPQSMLINVLRSMLKGRPLVEGFKDPEMMQKAVEEAKSAMKQMQFLEAFRLFKAKKEQQRKAKAAESGEAPVEEPSTKQACQRPAEVAEDGSEEEEARDPRRQPFCWVYVLRKPL